LVQADICAGGGEETSKQYPILRQREKTLLVLRDQVVRGQVITIDKDIFAVGHVLAVKGEFVCDPPQTDSVTELQVQPEVQRVLL